MSPLKKKKTVQVFHVKRFQFKNIAVIYFLGLVGRAQEAIGSIRSKDGCFWISKILFLSHRHEIIFNGISFIEDNS